MYRLAVPLAADGWFVGVWLTVITLCQQCVHVVFVVLLKTPGLVAFCLISKENLPFYNAINDVSLTDNVEATLTISRIVQESFFEQSSSSCQGPHFLTTFCINRDDNVEHVYDSAVLTFCDC